MKKKPKEESLLKMNNFLVGKDQIEAEDKTFKNLMFVYSVATKELVNKMEILKEESKVFYDYELIDHINTRIKKPESIIKKLERKQCECTYENMIKNVNDIAGVRIVCPLQNDIFTVRNLVTKYPEIRVLKEKDYVTKPKKSGYSSYHMIVEVPVMLSQKNIYVKAEIQIRTLAMDFFASIEHRLKYKPEEEIGKKESKQLVSYAKTINKLDSNMMILSSK